MPNCPKCNSERTFKFGIVRNKQRYKCKDCSFNYTSLLPSGKPQELKRKALQLYLEGLGFRAIGRIIGVSQVSIMNWIKNFGENLPVAPKPKNVEIMELDEMWHYVRKKNGKDGYGSLFVEVPRKSSTLQWVVVERRLEENSGQK